MTLSEPPHSRACGINPHEHGTACSTNCPSCGGRPMTATANPLLLPDPSGVGSETITPAIAAHVLHHFGAGGYQAGSFVQQLIALAAAADPANFRRLALGFRGYVAAVQLAMQAHDGLDELRAIAGDVDQHPAAPPTLTPESDWNAVCRKCGRRTCPDSVITGVGPCPDCDREPAGEPR